jgi:hypothetical protein
MMFLRGLAFPEDPVLDVRAGMHVLRPTATPVSGAEETGMTMDFVRSRPVSDNVGTSVATGVTVVVVVAVVPARFFRKLRTF